MTSDQPSVACGNCGTLLAERTDLDATLREPCPACGSLTRSMNVRFADSLTFRSLIGIVHKGDRPRVRGRRLVESKTGDSQSADGTWAYVEQVVDRVHGRYRKLVVAADGRVIKDVDRPIDDQHAHGPPKQPPAR
jgi:hypothetical protein